MNGFYDGFDTWGLWYKSLCILYTTTQLIDTERKLWCDGRIIYHTKTRQCSMKSHTYVDWKVGQIVFRLKAQLVETKDFKGFLFRRNLLWNNGLYYPLFLNAKFPWNLHLICVHATWCSQLNLMNCKKKNFFPKRFSNVFWMDEAFPLHNNCIVRCARWFLKVVKGWMFNGGFGKIAIF